MFQISLKAARVNAGLTQKEVAKNDNIRVDVATIVSWENGKTFPKAPQLQALCALYKIPIDYIFLGNKFTISEHK